jgi:cell division protein FtsQ
MKKLIKPTLYLLSTLLFLSGVIWTLEFAHRQQTERVCDQVRIFIKTNNSDIFITEDAIIQQLSAAKLYPNGVTVAILNTHAIEKYLLKNSAIQSVNVFTQISGEVDIEIVQRHPIVRIENAKRQQFYIGSDGHLMATIPSFSARLIVANGNISESFYSNKNIAKSEKDKDFSTPILYKIYQLATFIQNDEFLNALIDQIYVNSKNEFELVPKIGNQIIFLGNAENFEDQFKRLHQFYHHAIKKVDKNTYRFINLKYDNQVIGTRI